MQGKNLNYLKDQVKYTGFGDGLENKLKENMQQGQPTFTLEHQTKFGNDDASATLHFRKSAETDNYFFNKYDLSVKAEGEKDAIKQTFHIGYDNNITLKEGYNLLSGRSVNKEMAKLVDTCDDGSKRLEAKGEKYNAWLKMDLTDKDQNGNFKIKQYHQNYGFDLESALSKLPIKELANAEDKSRLVESLQKGNRQSVTFVIDGKEEKRFIEAAPQFKSINQYDAQMKRAGFKRTQSETQSQTEQQKTGEKVNASTEKKSAKQAAEPGGEDTKKQGRAQRKGRSVT
jgi:hypothetical protein